jgi:hypothetical protein
VGALGKATHARRLERLKERGFNPEQLKRTAVPSASTSARVRRRKSPLRFWRMTATLRSSDDD